LANKGPIEKELFILPVIEEEPLGNLSLPKKPLVDDPETGMLTGFETPTK